MKSSNAHVNALPEKDLSVVHQCSNCVSNVGTKRCKDCKHTYYCSVGCQKEDWPQHKNECAFLARGMSELYEHQKNSGGGNVVSLMKGRSVALVLFKRLIEDFLLAKPNRETLAVTPVQPVPAHPISPELRSIIRKVILGNTKNDQIAAFVVRHQLNALAEHTLEAFCRGIAAYFEHPDAKPQPPEIEGLKAVSYIGPVSKHEIARYGWMRPDQAEKFFLPGGISIIVVVQVQDPQFPVCYVLPRSKLRSIFS